MRGLRQFLIVLISIFSLTFYRASGHGLALGQTVPPVDSDDDQGENEDGDDDAGDHDDQGEDSDDGDAGDVDDGDHDDQGEDSDDGDAGDVDDGDAGDVDDGDGGDADDGDGSDGDDDDGTPPVVTPVPAAPNNSAPATGAIDRDTITMNHRAFDGARIATGCIVIKTLV